MKKRILSAFLALVLTAGLCTSALAAAPVQDEAAQVLLYGTELREGDAVYAAGPYLTGQDGEPLLPPVEEGTDEPEL